MSCFHCLCCCKPSMDSCVRSRRREGASRWLCCKRLDEGEGRKRGGCGIGCLCCCESSSSSKHDSSKNSACCFHHKKSSIKGTETRIEGKDRKCVACFNSSSDEGKKRKRRGSEIGCLCCCNSSSKDASLESRGCCCLPFKKSSKEAESKREGNDKKCSTCFRSSKERKERKRRGSGTGCLCCKESSSKEDVSKEDMTERRGCCCFSSKKSLKKDMESREEKDTKCFSCFRLSKEEGKDRNKRGCGIQYFCYDESSLKDESPKARICCYLPPKNSSKEDLESRGGKDKRCFSCFKSSKKYSLNKGKRGTSCCFYCCDNKLLKEDSSKKEGRTISKSSEENSSKKGRFCFQCCSGKLPKKLDLGETVSQKKKLNEDSTKKRGSKVMCCCGFCCTKSIDERKQTTETKCTFSCFCCVQSKIYQNPSFRRRKRALSCWKIKKQPQVGNHLATMMHTLSLKSDYDGKDISQPKEILPLANSNSSVQVFTYKELVAATKNFSEDCLLGSGGCGRVYKGQLQGKNKDVAVKQLKRSLNQGNNEFPVDVVMLCLLHNPNLVKLLGYCAEEDQMILVYEYMPFGSLQDHLLDVAPNNKPLDWFTRMKIATGAAKGLEHLHDIADPPIIYCNLKASNVLLDESYNTKLSDFGLEKSTRGMGAYGCYAPEYAFTRQLTKTTDVYSFGVLLLELITGRKAMDITRPKNDQYLAHWATPIFKDKRTYPRMVDPLLNGNYPIKGLYQALAIANMCLQYEASSRPLMSDIVTAIEYLMMPETDFYEPLEEPSIPHQLVPSNHEKPKFQSISGNSRMRTSFMSLDDESFQSLPSDIESCGALREEDEKVEA